MKAFVRGLLARAYEGPKIQRKLWNQKKWEWKETAGFGCVTSPPPPEKGLENLTVADVLMIKDTDGGKVDSWISCRTNDTVFDAVKNVRSTPFFFHLITLHTLKHWYEYGYTYLASNTHGNNL